MNGLIEWFARHRVAANMLMWLILLGGLLTVPVVEQEVFPDVGSDMISVSVPFRGATPEDVESGVCIKIEEALAGVEGIKRLTSDAREGLGTVSVEIEVSADIDDVLDDVQAAVDTIDSFPLATEKPVVVEVELVRQVLNVGVAGDVGEKTLRLVAEGVRDDILALPGITRVELRNVRPYEISIEVSESDLRRWGLSFDEVTRAVREGSVDLGGGSVKTAGGEIQLRTKAQAYRQRDFEQIALLTRPDGSRLLLGDVARIVDGFEDTGQASRLDGSGAIMVRVFRVGDQRALEVAHAAREYIERARAAMPPGITLTTFQDESRVLESRLDLLLRNGRTGLLLVFLTLALFLRLSLAFWVTLGIPISFLGTLWLMPTLGVSINMISLFGFLVALGIVVDDAIVVGENIHAQVWKGKSGLDAVLTGTKQVATPVIFAILTTAAAFMPLRGVPGTMGKFIGQLPLIVVPILAFSMIESLLILPSHLVHLRQTAAQKRSWLVRRWEAVQGVFIGGMTLVIERFYRPSLDRALRWRYVSLAIGFVMALLTFSLLGSGHLRFLFFPPVEADNVVAYLTLPQGTPSEVTSDAVRQIEAAARRLADEFGQTGDERLFKHMLASVGDQPLRSDMDRGFGGNGNFSGAHLGEVNIELFPSEERSVSARDLLARWRTETGPVADAVELVFRSDMINTGKPLDIQLTGQRVDELRDASAALALTLREYPGVYDVSDSFRSGKQELRLSVTPEAEAMGLTRADLARQVRQGFYGEEAQRVQRGRDEVRVMVRYPEAERRALGDLENMRVRLPGDVELPFNVVAAVERSRGDAVIERSDRRRSLHVTADVDLSVNDPNVILADVAETVLPELLARFPGIDYTFEGQQREQADTMAGLARGFLTALVLIYALLAVPFRSYTQPAIVMLAIPFGIVGAMWGHLLLGMDLTVMSMFGVVALTGVIVNDSLIMVDFINNTRAQGASVLAAVREAGPARFRAILLTSLTTFAGLTPLLLERSLQARFLIPMAVSLGFGVIFATFITLILVPCAYVVLQDLLGWWGRVTPFAPVEVVGAGAAKRRTGEGETFVLED